MNRKSKIFISVAVFFILWFTFYITNTKRFIINAFENLQSNIKITRIESFEPKTKEINYEFCKNKNCKLSDGTKIQTIKLNDKTLYITDIIKYKPAGNTICTKFKTCKENDDWWEGARLACEKKGMSLPDINTFNDLYNLNDTLKFKGYFWTSIQADDIGRAYEFYFPTGKYYIANRINENNVICAVIRFNSNN